MSLTKRFAIGVENSAKLLKSQIRRRRPKLGHKWHLDEVRVVIKGEVFWLWRAVDEDGNLLDVLMQRRRNKAAAKKLMRKLLKRQGFAPRVRVTDQLKSYAAKTEILPDVEHRQHQGLNNRAANSHQSTRLREKKRKVAVMIASGFPRRTANAISLNAGNPPTRMAQLFKTDAKIQVSRSSATISSCFRVALSAYSTKETSVACLDY